MLHIIYISDLNGCLFYVWSARCSLLLHLVVLFWIVKIKIYQVYVWHLLLGEKGDAAFKRLGTIRKVGCVCVCLVFFFLIKKKTQTLSSFVLAFKFLFIPLGIIHSLLLEPLAFRFCACVCDNVHVSKYRLE